MSFLFFRNYNPKKPDMTKLKQPYSVGITAMCGEKNAVLNFKK